MRLQNASLHKSRALHSKSLPEKTVCIGLYLEPCTGVPPCHAICEADCHEPYAAPHGEPRVQDEATYLEHSCSTTVLISQ